MKKIVSLLLVVVMMFTMPISVFAVDVDSEEAQMSSDVYYYEVDEDKHTTEAVSSINSNLFYAYSDESFSYCAQIIPGGKIQFSYYRVEDDTLVESGIYDMEELYLNYSIAQDADQNYVKLNREIMDNIGNFSDVHVVGETPVTVENTESGIAPTAVDADLSDAIAEKFGSNYTGLFKGLSNKSYGGTTYKVKCTESQTTSYTDPDSQWFAKDTAVSAIVAWAIGGAWSWKAAVVNLIVTVVTTIIVNGVEKTISNFTAKRTNVSLMHTRLVTVNGYSGTHYWAGWTRKTYFFKGEDDWVSDTGENWNLKHTDFDDVTGLLETGWSNFVNYTLTDGY